MSRLRVARVDQLTAEIRQLVLHEPDGRRLADYVPGSHIVLTAGGKRNAYSLTGSGIAPSDYRISVLRRSGGTGSVWLHGGVKVGDLLEVEGPRSTFAPEFASTKSLLIAAGIGVTPILSHLKAARVWGRQVEVVYGYRPGAAAHLDELRDLAGPDLVEAPGRRALAAALGERVTRQPWGTHAYACGPIALLDLFKELAAGAGWPPVRVHLEHFVAPELAPGRPFEAVLRRSGTRLLVPSGVSLLDAVLAAGVEVPNMCRQGVCGQCLVGVTRGRIEHRDLVLSAAERDTHMSMLACVSRAADRDLEVDL